MTEQTEECDMAEVIPFRGVRYNTDFVNPNETTSPPYDVISPAERAQLHKRHPKNMVRLILGMEKPEDDESSNRFTRASQFFHDWLADGTLMRDSAPVFYAYEQYFTAQGKPRTIRGIIGAVKLHDFSEGVILPHEYTLARPKSDLAKLIRATNANLDSVYGLYPDRTYTVDLILDRIAATEPQEEAIDALGVRHRLWVVSNVEDIAAVTNAISDKQIVIADGHHRYETSLAYRDELREANPSRGAMEPYDYVMITLVNAYSDNMVVLPTHRLIRHLPEAVLSALDDRLGAFFDAKPSDAERLTSDMANAGGAIGLYRNGKAEVLVPKPNAELGISGSDARKGLDVIVLHEAILDGMLGIDAERLRQQSNVVYVRDEQEAFADVDSGEFQAAFLMNPIDLEVMFEMTRAGERMPQKATYFYPKLLSGFVMRSLDGNLL